MNELDLGFTEEAGPSRRQVRGRRRRDRRRKRRGGLAILVAFVVVVAVLGGVGYAAYAVIHNAVEVPDYSGPGSGTVTVHIDTGDSIRAMGDTLEKAQVVKSAKAFRLAASKDPKSMGIQPGYYRLNKHMAATLALDKLLDPASRILSKVTVPEGLRTSKVLPLLAKATGKPLSQFESAAKHPSDLGLPSYAHGKVEGYLFPATYEFPPTATPRGMLKAMVSRYRQEEQDLGLASAAKKVGLTPGQVVTVASMLEVEGRKGDYDKVARVVYNRDRLKKPLQFDSTVLYALGRSDLNVSLKDTRVKSPYNTYLHVGLPPGPITNPGEQTIKAALHPAKGNWIYFVTTNPKTGETKFTASYKQFLKYKAEFKRNS